MDKIAAIQAISAAKKNGTLVPYSAKNPPIPGPIINPVDIDADIYPRAFGRSSIVVISAINAVTAGIINAALTPPSMRDKNNTYKEFPMANNNSEKLKKNNPNTIIFFRPMESTNLPANGDTASWVSAKAATKYPSTFPVICNSFINVGRTGITSPIPKKAINKFMSKIVNVILEFFICKTPFLSYEERMITFLQFPLAIVVYIFH